MLALVFHWDEAEAFTKDQLARKKLLKQWTHTAKAFGVTHLIAIGDVQAIPKLYDAEIHFEVFSTYAKVRDKYQGYGFTVIREGGTDLQGYSHPTSGGLYVVGSNYADPVVRRGDHCVGFPSETPVHDVIAAGIVLQDRYRKCR